MRSLLYAIISSFLFFSIYATHAQQIKHYKTLTPPFKEGFSRVVFAPPPYNHILAVSYTNNKILIWDEVKGTIIKELEGHSAYIKDMCFSDDAKYLASAGYDFKIKVWELSTAKKIREFDVEHRKENKPTQGVPFVKFLNNTQLIFGGYFNSIMQVDIGSYAIPKVLINNNLIYNATCSGTISLDKKYLAFCDGKVLKMFNLDKKTFEKDTCIFEGNASGLYFSNTGNTIVANILGGFTHFYDRTSNNAYTLNNDTASFDFISLTTDFNWLLRGENNNNNISLSFVGSKKPFSSVTLETAKSYPEMTITPTTVQLCTIAGTGNAVQIWHVLELPDVKKLIELETPQFDAPIVNDPPEIPSKLEDRNVAVLQNIKVKSKYIQLQLSDKRHNDGDIISIMYNGNWILENYILTPNKKKLTLPIAEKGKNSLIVYAVSQGTYPPATASISVFDGVKDTAFIIQSSQGKCQALTFEYDPK